MGSNESTGPRAEGNDRIPSQDLRFRCFSATHLLGDLKQVLLTHWPWQSSTCDIRSLELAVYFIGSLKL